MYNVITLTFYVFIFVSAT